MKVSTFVYAIKQGIKNIWRNKMFSLASIATMSACIFLFGLFFSIVTNFKTMVKTAEEGVAVTVFFNDGTTQDQIDKMKIEIEKRPEVAKCQYVSAEEAWKNYKNVYFNGSEDAAAGFADDNPLANSASFAIYMRDISMQNALVTYLHSVNGVREVHQSEVVANTLSDFNSLMGYISVGIILILLGVAIFLISNTVTVGISVRREEIAIMKLIGATDFFVRAPFVVEGILIGLLGSIIPLVMLYFVYSRVVSYVMNKFSFLNNMMNFLPAGQVFHILIPVSLALGVGIGFVGSRLTIRKHLKV
jgi:cell division transport system permease protein